MVASEKERVEKATSLYSKSFLHIYDSSALRLNCRFIWRCPSHLMLGLYNNFVTANHLDIGVGTGYFLDRCRFPGPNPRLALMDLNPNSLDIAGKRLARFQPEIYRRNVLEPWALDGQVFDSVAIMNLLHCLPGDMSSKGAVYEHARTVMNPGAVLFGSTILGKGVKYNPFTQAFLKWINRKGFMSNTEDDAASLRDTLSRYFSSVSVEVTGYVALFQAKI